MNGVFLLIIVSQVTHRWRGGVTSHLYIPTMTFFQFLWVGPSFLWQQLFFGG